MRVAWACLPLAVAVFVVLVRVDRQIEPVANYWPPIPPLTGVLAPNNRLDPAKQELLASNIPGPEDCVHDLRTGTLYLSASDGWIYFIEAPVTAASAPKKLVYTGGRALGLAMDTPRNQLVFADKRGLMAVDLTTRQLHCLVTEVDGIPLGLTDDVAVAQDGTVYLTDATRLGLGSEEVLTISALELLEGRGSGRLVKYDPATRTATVLMRNLLFANGVALSKNEDFLVVGDMGRAQILRLWLKGDRAGTRDVLIDNLVGMADGIWTDPEDGTFWVAVFAFRDGMSQLLSKTPFVAKILANLPGWMLLPAIVPSPYNLVLHYDASGRLVESLHGTGQHAMPVTSVSRFDNKLFLGTLIGNGIRVLQL